ncbi:NADPH-dependent ferric siderophore reductase, contains FAD-binding and SIP domains [Polaromonas sp. OV174]|uniref:siderophore-interacting protein n=1 Tax=Polaromonas sp. OV174 TaxID=1855300 RepID=UPI0008E614D7|nr:siderophore-interacting protein [Polaromonas sp. OV174]SFC15544.1 NADPH-dependent ferric siderophore reductase, contains FAD-binding and SIP domains [Polaromonas sp. OV174]
MTTPSLPEVSSPPAVEAAPRKRRPPRRVEVTRVQVLSPLMRRITLHGSELQGFEVNDPASYMKLIFPEPGQTEPDRPLPDGPRAKSMRTYTPLAVRPEALEVDVDFVLHGDGPASTWAAQVEVGQVLFLMGPGPGYKLALDAQQHVLIGDDSALPAFETILAALPATASIRLLMEVADAAEERALHSPAALATQWVVRGADNTQAGTALEAALRLAGPPAAEARIYLACEAAAMRRLRLLLINELGVDRARIVGRGYWKLGTVNHPDHDYGDEA